MAANTIINYDNNPMFSVKDSGITILGRTRVYEKYSDMINDRTPPKFAWCIDATGDSSVNQGAAFYVRKENTWQKLYESEAMDTDLIFTPENYQELIETVNDIKNRIESGNDSEEVTNHINNASLHVSAYDRELWNTVDTKVNIEEGKGLSSNDFTDEYKSMLDSSVDSRYDDTEIRQGLSDTNERIDETRIILESFIAEQLRKEAEFEEAIRELAQI